MGVMAPIILIVAIGLMARGRVIISATICLLTIISSREIQIGGIPLGLINVFHGPKIGAHGTLAPGTQAHGIAARGIAARGTLARGIQDE